MNQSRKNTDTTTAAQKHLQAASDLLLSTSPHASAFLAHQLRQSKPPTPSSSFTAPDNCQACGNALIPGWSCTVSSRRLPEVSKKPKTISKSKVAKKPTVARITYIDYKCTLCNSINTNKSDTQAPARRSKSRKSLLESKPAISPVATQTSTTITKPTATMITPNPLPSTAISSSSDQGRGGADKKRNRKQKLGGLHAMLAKSKAPSSTPKGFDFMDFMKTT
jgi:phage FluMu protein Com